MLSLAVKVREPVFVMLVPQPKPPLDLLLWFRKLGWTRAPCFHQWWLRPPWNVMGNSQSAGFEGFWRFSCDVFSNANRRGVGDLSSGWGQFFCQRHFCRNQSLTSTTAGPPVTSGAILGYQWIWSKMLPPVNAILLIKLWFFLSWEGKLGGGPVRPVSVVCRQRSWFPRRNSFPQSFLALWKDRNTLRLLIRWSAPNFHDKSSISEALLVRAI